VVSNVVTQALAGEDITVYGDGSQTRSFCYVEDLVGGLAQLGASGIAPHGPVNLGNPVELTVGELVERVLAMTGSRSAVVRRPLPVDDPRRRRPDITEAGRLLGWRPVVSLEAGLRATIAHFAQEEGQVLPLHPPAVNDDDTRRPRRAAAGGFRAAREALQGPEGAG
jgi:UDP-glucuronate decarboxylase